MDILKMKRAEKIIFKNVSSPRKSYNPRTVREHVRICLHAAFASTRMNTVESIGLFVQRIQTGTGSPDEIGAVIVVVDRLACGIVAGTMFRKSWTPGSSGTQELSDGLSIRQDRKMA